MPHRFLSRQYEFEECCQTCRGNSIVSNGEGTLLELTNCISAIISDNTFTSQVNTYANEHGVLLSQTSDARVSGNIFRSLRVRRGAGDCCKMPAVRNAHVILSASEGSHRWRLRDHTKLCDSSLCRGRWAGRSYAECVGTLSPRLDNYHIFPIDHWRAWARLRWMIPL